MTVDLRLLGPVQVWVGPRNVHIGPPRRRSVLAILLVEANQLVRVEQLVDRVWGDRPPSSARDVLASHVARLRTALPGTGAQLPRGGGGYRLEVDPELVDLHRFRAHLQQARTAADADAADECIQGALALWRGEPFAGTTGPWLPQIRESLTSEWLVATLDHADHNLRRDRPDLVVGDLLGLAARYPLDERLLSQLMVALARTGRRAEALERYEQARHRLADELGVDPADTLLATYRAILRDQPGDHWPANGTAIAEAAAAVSLQLPRVMHAAVAAEASRRGVMPSALIRSWVEAAIAALPDPAAPRMVNADLAALATVVRESIRAELEAGRVR